MKTRLLALFLTVLLVLSLLPGCQESSVIDSAEAQKIAISYCGLSEKDVGDVHVHLSTDSKIPSFNVYITVGSVQHHVVVSAHGEVESYTSGPASEHSH